jgi:molybdenum cofactor synthesis domain-containing protein
VSAPIRAAILTVSDRCSRGEAVDLSGPALGAIVVERLRGEVVETACIPDETGLISDRFIQWADPSRRIDLILSTGGTGLAPRDVTPEAALAVIERRHAGLMELARARCAAITPRAYLSRGVAGTINRTLIITLPGSVRGATENCEALLDILPHAIETLRGEVADDGRSPDGSTPSEGRIIVHKD